MSRQETNWFTPNPSHSHSLQLHHREVVLLFLHASPSPVAVRSFYFNFFPHRLIPGNHHTTSCRESEPHSAPPSTPTSQWMMPLPYPLPPLLSPLPSTRGTSKSPLPLSPISSLQLVIASVATSRLLCLDNSDPSHWTIYAVCDRSVYLCVDHTCVSWFSITPRGASERGKSAVVVQL